MGGLTGTTACQDRSSEDGLPLHQAIAGGNPFLPHDLRVDLELLDERRFGNGVVYLRYGVQGSAS